MRNILILGGLGFIGSNIIKELLENGKTYNVIAYDLAGKKNRFGERIRIMNDNFQIDGSLEKLLTETPVDIVIHLISTTIPASSNEKIIYDIEANLIPTINLLKLLIKYKVPEIIFLSSGGSVYGMVDEEKVNELHQTFPISSHGTIKLTIEKYIHLFQELYGINYLILRVGNAYGPFQTSDDQGIINVFLRKILKNEKLIVRGDGSAVRDYIYVKDLAKVVRFLIEIGVKNEIINVGSGYGTSIKQLVSILDKVSGKKNKVDYIEMLVTDVPKIVLDISKLRSILDPDFLSLEEGIRHTYEGMIRNEF